MAEKQAKKQARKPVTKPVKGRAIGPRAAARIGEVVVGPVAPPIVVGPTPPPIIITPGPIPHAIEYVGNLFSGSRPGDAVVRPDDLVALRIELVNVTRKPGSKPPVLAASGSGAASLIVHHPPQSIAEEVFFEQQAAGTGTPDMPPPLDGKPAPSAVVPDNDVDPPPIRARAANESRVVFEWPAGFECPYTLDGLLGAIRTLDMRVPPGALPRPAQRRVLELWPRWQRAAGVVVTTKTKAKATSITATTLLPVQAMVGLTGPALNAFSLRQTQIARRGGEAAQATLRRRLGDVIGSQATLPDAVIVEVPPVRRVLPKPALPTSTQTAIELPWRLIISPHDGEHWRHATKAATSPYSGHTELWHTRLLGPAGVDSPAPDAGRTVRAVWATTGWGQKAMQSAFPSGFTELPGPDAGNPFVTSETALSDYDRYQITHLSSNFSMTNYEPQPIDTRLLMLSSQGAWLDSRGDWEPPGLDVESWVHQATQGRDHYVRVVYRGVLFPFGHRAVLIKVSERKFHKLPGNPAYLRQRMFMIVREKIKHYDDASTLRPFGAGDATVEHELPFTSVRMLTTVTPDLAQPIKTQVEPGLGQLLFWPATGPGDSPTPFPFRMAGTDLDGREVQFELPLIFMSNTMASPRDKVGNKLVPKHSGTGGAADTANRALTGWRKFQIADAVDDPQGTERATAQLKRQRVTLALSSKPGDTAVEVAHLTFDAHVPSTVATSTSFKAFKSFTPDLLKPMFYPRVSRLKARIGAMAQLTGSDGFNRLRWNTTYLQSGFDPGVNKGEVFAEVVERAGMGRLDFSKQGDRSGGFVMPNLSPSALSRSLGPAAGNVADVVGGQIKATNFFPPGGAGDLPLPLLFGCIPLSAVIHDITQLFDNIDKAPKFASEAGTKVEAFFNDLMRLYQFISSLASQPGTLGSAALDVVKGTINDLLQQAAAFGAAQLAPITAKVNTLLATLDSVKAQLDNLGSKSLDAANPLAGINLADALDAPQGNGALRAKLVDLKNTVQASTVIPAGYRQQVNAVVAQALTVLDSIKLIAGLVGHGKTLFDALKNLLDNPAAGQSLGELITKPAELAPKVEAVKNALGAVKGDVAAFPLLEGPPRKTLLDILGVVEDGLGAVGPLLQMLENLLGEELVVRFDWKPEIKSWGFDPASPLFVVHDKHAFIVAVEARMKKSGGAPKIQVLCGLHHFDLVLIAPASFIELNFEKIEFSVDSSAKMNVDVMLSGIKFVGPLSFVETLRDLIPLDGFSDPPYLDITAQGIDAGFDVALPAITCGVLNLSNVSLGAGFTVPFIGQPLSVRFNFCTREQPFHLTVYVFGGGGFFGITLDPKGVQILEAAFEFGAAISIDFGVASGGVSVMAGIYFRMEADAASLTGYFRLEGHVDVLGLITASLELYLELRYEFETGKAVGKATLTIEIEVFIFSGSVTISCEKKFAGSNGDPTLRQLLGLSADPTLALAAELAAIDDSTRYGWRDYCEAFA
ncbi:hypothetical protein [Pelomonas sp. Root1237]|uniref:hypothetical protein n=1 Tax=Pelomonas sp. Root1237 TaxID=1736434 RepID=UPI000A6BDFF4|nr:hypothetical protein [Pelomonas sp. Root1237]